MHSPLSTPDPWNAVAGGYADEVLPIFTLYARDALRLARLPDGARVLDVATGPGTLAIAAAEAGAWVTAVDFAEDMLEECRRRTASFSSVAVESGDGQALPFDDEAFDGVFSMFGLVFFPDQAAGFREARRVLKPGGRAVVSSWEPLDAVPLLEATFRALGDLLAELPFGEGRAPLGTPGALAAALREAGFRDADVHRISHSVDVPDVRTYWTANVRSSAPIALVRSQVEPQHWADVSAGVMDALEREFGTGPQVMTWPALLGVGVR